MSDIQKTKHTLHKGADQAESLIEQAQSKVTDLVDEVKDRGEELLKEVKDRSRLALEKSRERGEETWDDMTNLVRKYPGRSLGIAFLAGAVAFAYFSRNDD